jgi:type IV secretory pathway TraG/TraD family ATPase VirD4
MEQPEETGRLQVGGRVNVPLLHVDRDAEASHFLVCGDSGSGKSQFIKQVMRYACECDDSMVVLDSKLELISEFYNPAAGDWILSPKDERCPYMNVGSEVEDSADALSVMRAFYPAHADQSNSRFFDDHAWRISSYIVHMYRPDYLEYGRWLQIPDREIYPKLKGTEHEVTLNKNAAPQKAGIDGTLNEVGMAMRMMPGTKEGRPALNLREWATGDRNGSIFLPNPARLREAQRPLLSGWIDMLIRFVMSAKEQRRRVWFILDELDTLNGLPAVAAAVTEMRSTQNPIVLGMQNVQQLEDRYGKKANTIMSQAYTKVILATSEPNSKKSLSELIGDALFRRYRLSSGRGSSTSGPEEFVRPLVMPSEIGSLKNLNGYLMQRGEIVKIKLPYRPSVERQPAMIERTIPESASGFMPIASVELPLAVKQPIV